MVANARTYVTIYSANNDVMIVPYYNVRCRSVYDETVSSNEASKEGVQGVGGG